MRYPENYCPRHPKEMWSWDGYGWICVECILEPRTFKPWSGFLYCKYHLFAKIPCYWCEHFAPYQWR